MTYEEVCVAAASRVSAEYGADFTREWMTVQSSSDVDVFIYAGQLLTESVMKGHPWRIESVTVGNELADHDTATIVLVRRKK